MSESEPPTQQPQPAAQQHPILIIVMGVAGTGKTTLARALAARLRLAFVEGDELHPPANVAKMSAGTPLTDADRAPWLRVIRTTAEHVVAEQQAQHHDGRRPGVLITCSALRRCYRDVLRGVRKDIADPPVNEEGEARAAQEGETLPARTAPEDAPLPAEVAPPPPARLPTFFVHIAGSVALMRARIAAREGHFMKPGMLDSQLATLEDPAGEPGVVVVPLDASTDEQVRVALDGLRALVGEPL